MTQMTINNAINKTIERKELAFGTETNLLLDRKTLSGDSKRRHSAEKTILPDIQSDIHSDMNPGICSDIQSNIHSDRQSGIRSDIQSDMHSDMNPGIRIIDRSACSEEEKEPERKQIKIKTNKLSFFYGGQQALFENDLEIEEKSVTAIIGPSGCGKSTHLRIYNRIFELYGGQRATGEVLIDGKNILASDVDLLELRRRVGMIFQKPTPFPMSVYENIAYPLRLHFRLDKTATAELVEDSLRSVSLWDEVKDKLGASGLALSGGQQQRLCMARAIAVRPEILLMDEPTSAIDPVVTLKIEETILKLKERFTIVIVTHNMQQAARVSDYTAFFYKGNIIEHGRTDQLFTNPREKKTEEYITGRFG